MVATVGLTGGIACGKSTVARFFEELGVPVVDADAIAREIVAPGTDALREIVVTFGPQILCDDGTLDRKRLGEVVFADADARAALESITHPRIGAASAARIAEAGASGGVPYVLYEAALLVENGLHRLLAALVVVTADEATQLARLMARDGLDEAAARARIGAQLPLAEKVACADHVIDNSGDLAQTRAGTEAVHRALLERLGGGSEA